MAPRYPVNPAPCITLPNRPPRCRLSTPFYLSISIPIVKPSSNRIRNCFRIHLTLSCFSSPSLKSLISYLLVRFFSYQCTRPFLRQLILICFSLYFISNSFSLSISNSSYHLLFSYHTCVTNSCQVLSLINSFFHFYLHSKSSGWPFSIFNLTLSAIYLHQLLSSILQPYVCNQFSSGSLSLSTYSCISTFIHFHLVDLFLIYLTLFLLSIFNLYRRL